MQKRFHIYIYIMLMLCVLSACGSAGPIKLTPVQLDDSGRWGEFLGAGDCVALEYEAPGAQSMTVDVLSWDGGNWTESGHTLFFPRIEERGRVILAFDELQDGAAAALLESDGSEQLLRSLDEEPAQQGGSMGTAYFSAAADVELNEKAAVAIQYYADADGGIAADIGDFANPGNLNAYTAVYALTLLFE